jgi:hypothetical protein
MLALAGTGLLKCKSFLPSQKGASDSI